MTDRLEAVGRLAAEYYALATPLLLVAGAAMAATRQPARRLALARPALVGLLALAAVPLVPGWPRVHLAAPAEPQPTPSQVGLAGPAAMVGPRAERLPSPMSAAATPLASIARPEGMVIASGSPMSWSAVGGGVYLAGMGGMLAWLALGAGRVRSARRRSVPAPVEARALLQRLVGGDRPAPELRVDPLARQPMAVGAGRAAILLPPWLVEDAPAGHLEAALAHEWAHVRGRDLGSIALLRLLLPILYAHPGYWWLRRRVRDDQELVADASAAAVGGRLDYAAALVAWSRRLAGAMPLGAGGAVALLERPSELRRRVGALLNPGQAIETSCSNRWAWGARLAVLPAVLGLSLLTTKPAAVGREGQDSPERARGSAVPADRGSATARVLGPDGRPVAGAQVYRAAPARGDLRPRPLAERLGTTGPDGSFRYPKAERPGGRDHSPDPDIAVAADGFGPVFFDSRATEPGDLRLVTDDVPIRGRVLDATGRPVVGAEVRVIGLLWSTTGTLDEWLARLKAEQAAYPAEYAVLRDWSGDGDPFLPAATTDAEGRFTLRGVGRERIAKILVSGPAIATEQYAVATRAIGTLRYPDFTRQAASTAVVYHGNECDLVGQPDLEAVGTVVDADTARPIAGVTVQTAALFGNPLRTLRTTTDAEGRYRLAGLSIRTKYGEAQELLVGEDSPTQYAPTLRSIRSADTANPITLDFQLKRGVLVRGRVVDGSTGLGVPAGVSYVIPESNPALKVFPRYGSLQAGMPIRADEDGNFRVVVLPGPGILGARAFDERFRLGQGLETTGLTPKPGKARAIYDTAPEGLVPINYNTVVGIDPKTDAGAIDVEVRLDPGRSVRGTVLGPDGQPLAGTRIEGLRDDMRRWSDDPLPTAEFVVEGLGLGESRDLIVVHEGQKLAAAVVVAADATGPVAVRLQPAATLTGRLLNFGGLPLAGVELTSSTGDDPSHRFGSFRGAVRTDSVGRFRIECFPPGRRPRFLAWVGSPAPNRPAYQELTGIPDLVPLPGQTLDLGDLKPSDGR